MNETVFNVLTTAGEGGGLLVFLAAILRYLYRRGVFKKVLNTLGEDMTVSMKAWVIEHDLESEEKANRNLIAMSEKLEEHIFSVEKSMNENLHEARQESINRAKETQRKLEELKQETQRKLDELKEETHYEIKASEMKQSRAIFFRFDEGIKRGVTYTREHWDSVRDLCKRYISFCEKHDKFINSECEGTVEHILEVWKTHPWEREEEYARDYKQGVNADIERILDE